MVIAAVARITGLPDHTEVAMAAAESVLSEPAVRPYLTISAKAGLTLLAVQKGDRCAAEEKYAYLLTQRGTMVSTVSSVDRLLGLVCQTMGNPNQAMAHFEDALAFCRKAGYRSELAWAGCDYADALTQRGGSGDDPMAMALLEESLAISTELGMIPLIERVVSRQEAKNTLPYAASANSDGLTQPEVEVIRLIASGKTNPEIATELVISVRTVANHVASIFNKTGSANRATAATYASRNGLL